jgi:hypothetical protein
MGHEMRACEEEYKRVVAKVPEFAELPYKDYLKITTLICSRNFYSADCHDSQLVVPFAGVS